MTSSGCVVEASLGGLSDPYAVCTFPGREHPSPDTECRAIVECPLAEAMDVGIASTLGCDPGLRLGHAVGDDRLHDDALTGHALGQEAPPPHRGSDGRRLSSSSMSP
jgi:hypothetical protein